MNNVAGWMPRIWESVKILKPPYAGEVGQILSIDYSRLPLLSYKIVLKNGFIGIFERSEIEKPEKSARHVKGSTENWESGMGKWVGGTDIQSPKFTKRTPRGSLVVVSLRSDSAIIEITNLEDILDLTGMLQSVNVGYKTHSGVSKEAWEDSSAQFRSPKPTSPYWNGIDYPGVTLEFRASDLANVLAKINQEYTGNIVIR